MQILTKIENIILNSRYNGMPFGVDATFSRDDTAKPVVVFIHGFKGFKDWGTFPLLATAFAQSGFVFVKFNLSHNGTSLAQPTDFANLEAFSYNNFTIELDDIGVVIDYLFSSSCKIPANEMDTRHLYILGHSRGGGLAIIKASEDMRIKKVATWAAVHDFSNLWKEQNVTEWQKNKVQYIFNSRTQQKMPLSYQLYQDYISNQDRLNICKAAQNLNIPLLLVHGDNDETVPEKAARQLKDCQPKAELCIVKEGQHTFGGSHPYNKQELPAHTREAIHHTIDFFKRS